MDTIRFGMTLCDCIFRSFLTLFHEKTTSFLDAHARYILFTGSRVVPNDHRRFSDLSFGVAVSSKAV